MDLLGMEGEKAAEGMQSIAGRLDDLESHLNAVDNAVQDVGNQVQAMQQNFVSQQELNRILNEPDQTDQEDVDLQQLKSFFVQMSQDQKQNTKRLEDVEELSTEFVETLQTMQRTLKKTHRRNKNLKSQVESIKEENSRLRNRLEKHEEMLEETEELKEEIEHVEKQQQKEKDPEDMSFDERTQDVEEELKDLRSSIKQFADRVDS
jgi:DNA repair exonuclease SbcCD ATPase subunit